ncbi:hypothetical protein E2C01_029109 [Portunus trituberculatus]|uniref:Uncharacterized protein n=1 Tax=Portunus trituberculatus TaxID=210409 RepID=A0A5B7EM82_PORTR|nr:hypothetical protein [Portunus trituberculatus]
MVVGMMCASLHYTQPDTDASADGDDEGDTRVRQSKRRLTLEFTVMECCVLRERRVEGGLWRVEGREQSGLKISYTTSKARH